MLPPTALSNVRQVKAKPSEEAAARRGGRKARAERLIIRHFASSALALYAGVVGLAVAGGARGAAHLGSAHGRSAPALALWGATYLRAQPRGATSSKRGASRSSRTSAGCGRTPPTASSALWRSARRSARTGGSAGLGGIGARWALPCCAAKAHWRDHARPLPAARRDQGRRDEAARRSASARRVRPPAMMADGSGGPKQQTTGPNVDAAAAEIGLSSRRRTTAAFDGQTGRARRARPRRAGPRATPGPPLLFAFRTAGAAVAAPATVATSARRTTSSRMAWAPDSRSWRRRASASPRRRALGAAMGARGGRRRVHQTGEGGRLRRLRAVQGGARSSARGRGRWRGCCSPSAPPPSSPRTRSRSASPPPRFPPAPLAPPSGWRGAAAACVGAQALAGDAAHALFNELPEFLFHIAIVAAAAAAVPRRVFSLLTAPAVVALAPGSAAPAVCLDSAPALSKRHLD